MTLNARMLGCVMLCCWFWIMLYVRRNGPDFSRVLPPTEVWRGILPALGFMVIAWWLLFR